MTAAAAQPECLLAGGRVLNVFTGELLRADVLMGGGRILDVGEECGEAPHTYRIDGGIVLPGLIDGHIHIESSLLTPPRFAEAVVPRGTTTVVADPHEIANVLGVEGVRWMLRASEGLPLECLFMAPSCVPASPHETSAARLDAATIAGMLDWDRVLGLAEVMDVPGVLEGEPDLARKLLAAARRGRPVDGHAPRLAGRALNAYLAAGIESDHECVSLGEAREKLRLGARVMIRQGSQAGNLRDLVPLLDPVSVRRCLLVSDDRNAADLADEGHVDHLLRQAVALGVPPLWAVQMVTLNVAEHFGLRRRGAVAPGWRADVVVVGDLEEFRCELVFRAGRLVAERGKLLVAPPPAPAVRPTMNVAPLTRDALRIPAPGRTARAIAVVPGQIETTEVRVEPHRRNGEVVADPARDLAKLVVVERHWGTGRLGLGLVHGLGLARGAIASSVSHDAHNLIAAGVDDGDLLLAIRQVVAQGGGFAVAAAGEVRARLPLPVAGLMTDQAPSETAGALRDVWGAAWELGATRPFDALAFLALPVIPALRLTDHGLVDVTRGALVPLAAD